MKRDQNFQKCPNLRPALVVIKSFASVFQNSLGLMMHGIGLKGLFAVAKLISQQTMFVIVLMSLVTRMYFIYRSFLGNQLSYVTHLNEALKMWLIAPC